MSDLKKEFEAEKREKSIFIDKTGLELVTGFSYSMLAEKWIRPGNFSAPVKYPGMAENSKKFWRRADVVAWTETLGAAE